MPARGRTPAKSVPRARPPELLRKLIAVAMELERRTMQLYCRYETRFQHPAEVRRFWFEMAEHESRHFGGLAMVASLLECTPERTLPAAPAMTRALDANKKHLDGAGRMLESLSHKSVLARGFVMVHRDDGTLVRAAKDLSPGDVVELTFADEKQKAVIDPARSTPAVETEPPKPRAKPKPGGDQGNLF